MRVLYHRNYVIGRIVEIKEGTEIYRVEQRETKKIVTLKNGGKLKDFKLNLISDGLVTEREFKVFQAQNKHLSVDQELIATYRKKLTKASELKNESAEITKLVFQ